MEQYNRSDLIPYWIWLATVYVAGLFAIDIMDVDAAQYASISLEMLENGRWLEVQHKGTDYLDKPPLVFWLGAFFYKVFGVGVVSFRLPSMLSSILGFWATYKLGEALYTRRTGQLAALVLASTQAWFLFNHDVRTDTLLSNFSIFAIWQIYSYLQNKKIWHFVLGFVGLGLAMLAKGPIGAVILAAAIGGYLLSQKAWKEIFHWRWLLGLLLVLTVLSPMLYGLWTQYGSEGIYFYFWKQSFGRITGENSWKDDTGAFFFVHTFLWSFLPWSVFALGAVIQRFKALWQGQLTQEWLCFTGFLLPFVALSFSQFKLPHYIFPLYPLMAILAADYLLQQSTKAINWSYKLFLGLQLFLMLLMLALALLILLWVFPNANLGVWLLLIFGLGISIFFFWKNANERLWAPVLLLFATLNLILNLHFYPNLLQYQSGTKVARYIHQQEIPADLVGAYGIYQHSLDFHLGKVAKVYESPDEIIQAAAQSAIWLYCDEKTKNLLEELGVLIVKQQEFEHFHVTKLNIKFLNPQKRKTQLKKVFLLKLEGVLG